MQQQITPPSLKKTDNKYHTLIIAELFPDPKMLHAFKEIINGIDF